MSKITIQNYHDCYEYGKKIVNGEMERKEAINTLYQKGMSERSATYYLQCVKGMMEGKKYTATVNQTATSYFLTEIYSEFGADGLRKALMAVKEHLQYQKGKNNLPSIETLYEEFSEIL